MSTNLTFLLQVLKKMTCFFKYSLEKKIKILPVSGFWEFPSKYNFFLIVEYLNVP